jgi:hypothetical protein
MTRAEFLTQCARVESAAEIGTLMEANTPDPAWLTREDAEVAWHCLQLQCLLSSAQQAIRVELDARVERVEQRLDQVGQLLAETRQQQAEVTAISDEIKAWWEEGKALWDTIHAATDDLDLFQAGYERGYAQGWQHRGEQPKEP